MRNYKLKIYFEDCVNFDYALYYRMEGLPHNEAAITRNQALRAEGSCNLPFVWLSISNVRVRPCPPCLRPLTWATLWRLQTWVETLGSDPSQSSGPIICWQVADYILWFLQPSRRIDRIAINRAQVLGSGKLLTGHHPPPWSRPMISRIITQEL